MRLLALRVIDQQVGGLREFLRRAHDLANEPAADSPARADLDHINRAPAQSDLVGLRWWAHRAAILNLCAAEEHLKGFRAVIDDEALLPLPAMALGRSVYEAVINTCWMVDVEVSTEQRLARWAGRLLHDGQEPVTALDSFGEAAAAQRERKRTAEARSLGQELMTSAGFELQTNREKVDRVTYRGASSTLTPKVDQLVDRFTPEQNLYLMFSGAAHSRGWLVNGLEGPDTDVIGSIIGPLLDTSDALAVETARYFGLNPRSTVERTHRHRVALLQRVRPGSTPRAGVDAFRASGGAWPLPPRT